jgi:hypothetical protein
VEVFLETPLAIIFVGVVIEAVLAAAFVNTRRNVLLAAMAGVAILVVAGVGLEWMIQTDAERVEATLAGAVDALEADDLERFSEHLAPEATATRQRAGYALSIVNVTSFKITGLRVTFNDLTSPPSAEARFRVTVRYRERAGIASGVYRAEFAVRLRRDDGRWLITGHDENATGG